MSEKKTTSKSGKHKQEEDSAPEAVGMTAVVPFRLGNRLKERGAVYSNGANWAPYVQVDGKLVTGQNPASSGPAAEELLNLLRSV